MKNINKIISIVILLGIWIIFSNFLNPLFLPNPGKVFKSFCELGKNGMLLNSILYSFKRITFATLISGAIAIPTGLLICTSKKAESFITPITDTFRFFPITAFYPLLILWIGIGEKMKIIFIVLVTIVYFLPTVVQAIKSTNKELIETGITIGMNKFQLAKMILLPNSLPTIFESFITMYGIGWTYIVIAESINAKYGLGHIINVSSARGRTDMVFVSLISILVLSFVFDTISRFVIKKIFKWKYALNEVEV